MNAYEFDQFTASESVQRLDPKKSASAERVFLTCEGGDVRYRYDSVGEPENQVGHLLTDGGYLILQGTQQIENFKFIQAGESVATLSASYERT